MFKGDYIYYVLFENHENGMKLYNALKKEGLQSTISPTPRSLSKCCGISLIINKEDIDSIYEIVKKESINIIGIENIKNNRNSNRDVYC